MKLPIMWASCTTGTTSLPWAVMRLEHGADYPPLPSKKFEHWDSYTWASPLCLLNMQQDGPIMYFFPTTYYFPVRFKYFPQHSVVLSLCSLKNEREQVSYPYEITGNIIVFYKLWTSDRKTKYSKQNMASISQI